MRKFSVQISQDPEQVVSRIQSAAKSHRIEFSGDTESGHFHGKGIMGNYVIDGNCLCITVHKKPIFLTWSLIETKLMDFFVIEEKI